MRKFSTAQLFVVIALFLTACGGSPTGPESDVASYQGVWQGTWVRASCSGTACELVPTSSVLRLTLTQSGTQAQGNVEIAAFVIPASGTVNSNGSLTLTGSVNQGGGTATLSNWNTSRSGSSLNGSFTLTIVPDDPQFGPQVVGVTLQSVAKTS